VAAEAEAQTLAPVPHEVQVTAPLADPVKYPTALQVIGPVAEQAVAPALQAVQTDPFK